MRAALLLTLALSGPCRAEDFRAFADALLSTGPLAGASVGAVFAELDEGATVYARNPALRLIPASTAKLALTAAALDALTPDFRFRTSFLARKGERGRGALSALVWRGSGDPSISGRGRSSSHEVFDLWGASLTALGVRSVRRLVLDGRAFEGPAVPPSWPPEELSYWYSAETSAIAFNDNCVDLRFIPGRQGRRPAVAMDPDFGYVRPRNRATTGPPGSPFTLDYRRDFAGNRVEFFGSIAAGDAPRSDYVAVHDPARFAGEALRRAWRAAAGPRVGRAVAWEKAGLPDDALEEVFAWESEPLPALIKVVNTNSQNLHAEQLLKALGRRVEGRGSFDAGLAVVRRFLARAGLDDGDHRLVDGSGLSPEDRLTAGGLTRLLVHMSTRPDFEAFHESLAVPGVDRSARGRMRGEPLASRMRLKRGTISGARNLAGYLVSRSGRRYAFAVLVNGPALDRPAVDEALDRLCLGAVSRLP